MFAIRRLRALTLAAVALSAFAASPAAGQTWDAGGGASTNWTTATNWAGDALPAVGADVTFATAGSTATVDVAGLVAGLVTFNRAAPFTINGTNALTVNTGFTTAASFTYTVSAPVTLGADNTFTTANGGTLNVSGLVTGGFGITRTASDAAAATATVSLSNVNNSYTGATAHARGYLSFAGSLPVSANSALGNSASAIALGTAATIAGDNLRFFAASGANVTVARDVVATAAVAGAGRYQVGTATAVTGASTWAGNITWGASTTGNNRRLDVFNASLTAPLNVTGNLLAGANQGALAVNGSGLGAGVVRLSGAGSTFTGNVTVTRGTLEVNGDAPNNAATNSVLGRGTLTTAVSLGDGANQFETVAGTPNPAANQTIAVLAAGAFTINRGVGLNNSNNAAFNSTIGAANAYVIGGTNTAGTATFAGNVTNTASTQASNVPDKQVRLTAAAGGTVAFTGTVASNGAVGTGDGSGVLNVFKEGAGTVALNNAGNTYDGITQVRNGTLLVGANAPGGAAGALGNSTTAVQLGGAGQPAPGVQNSAVPDTQAADAVALLTSAAGVTVGRDVSVNNFGATVTLGGSQAGASTFTGAVSLNRGLQVASTLSTTSVTFTGPIADASGSNGVTKVGSGTVTFAAANAYGGGTAINAGLLLAGNTAGSATGGGGVTVNGTGVLGGGDAAGTVGFVVPTSGGNVSVTSGTLAPGTGAVNAGVLTVGQTGSYSATVNLMLGSTFRVGLAAAGGGSAAPGGNGFSDPGAAKALLRVEGDSSTLIFSPSTVALVADAGTTGFDPSQYYSWTVAIATGTTPTVTFVAPSTINTASFLPPGGFTGTFSLARAGNAVYLNYAPVPEPAAVLLACAVGAGAVDGVRRRLTARA